MEKTNKPFQCVPKCYYYCYCFVEKYCDNNEVVTDLEVTSAAQAQHSCCVCDCVCV